MRYPPARRLDLVEELHGFRVADPYRWLEDAEADETEAWSKAQDELLGEWMDGRPGREAVRERLERLLGAGLVSVPVLRGERAFFERRRGDQQHPVLLVAEADGTERALIDPSALADDDTITLDGWVPSLEGERLAYFLSQGGDEEASLFIMDVASGETVEGPIDRTPLLPAGLAARRRHLLLRAPAARRRRPRGRGRLPPADLAPPGRDRPRRRRSWCSARAGRRPSTTPYGCRIDGRWLLVGAAAGTAPRNDLYIADLAGDGTAAADPGGGRRRDRRPGRDRRPPVPPHQPGRAPVPDRGRRPGPARAGGLARPGARVRRRPRGLRASTDDAAGGARPAGTRSAGSRCTTGRPAPRAARSTLPGPGSVLGVSARPEGGDEVCLGYTDFTTPPRVYRYQVARAASLELWMDAPGQVDLPAGVTTRQETYRSKDGTEVRLFLLHRDGLTPDGARPTILYGYGGFNIPLTPALERGHGRLGRAGRRLRDRQPPRRQRGGRGLAPRRHAGQQAERVRRLRRRRRAPDRRRLDVAGAAGHRRRLQRRAAGRRRPDPAAGAVRGRGLQRPAARHGPLRALRAGRDLERRVRRGRRPDRAGLAGRLLALPPGWSRARPTRRCCSPSSTPTPGSTRCTPARCAPPSRPPPPPTGRSCSAASARPATAPARSAAPSSSTPTS